MNQLQFLEYTITSQNIHVVGAAAAAACWWWVQKIIIIKEETLVLQDCVCNFVMGFFGAVHLKKNGGGDRKTTTTLNCKSIAWLA